MLPRFLHETAHSHYPNYAVNDICAVLYSLTEIETETEMDIFSLSETETAITETK